MISASRFRSIAALVLACMSAGALADNASVPLASPVLERPTLRSLGVYWIIRGDENRNATVSLDYRKPGESVWHAGSPLFRVERGRHVAEKYGTKLDVPKDAWLFAASVVLLEPGTAYEVRLALTDPDGGQATHTLATRTRAEPIAPANLTAKHVIPGEGGGSGTQADPFKGLKAAIALIKPGDLFLLHAGTYIGTVELENRRGTPDKPVIFRAAGDGEVILDGQGTASKRPSRVIGASGGADLFFENLTIRNADYGMVAHDAARLAIRRCRIAGVDYGFTATRNSAGKSEDFFIADNIIEGPSTWPRTKGIEGARGIQVSGAGHVVCYNRIRGFADAIDTFGSTRCEAIDIHNNDIYEMTDDGIEMDYSHRNTRCFHNRMTNVFQGISVQPVFGGPVYIFRNAMYNVCMEPFKIHNSPSGALFYHNTVVKRGTPLLVYTREPASNCVMRNNLYVGTEGKYVVEMEPKMTGCDFDYDGFAVPPGTFGMFLKWNNQRFKTLADVRQKAPVWTHAIEIAGAAGLFSSGILPPEDEKVQVKTAPDLRLNSRTGAIDAGQSLPGFNDGFAGNAPDLGAYEQGASLPHYGPRP